jgi:hypothetical protein
MVGMEPTELALAMVQILEAVEEAVVLVAQEQVNQDFLLQHLQGGLLVLVVGV